MSLRLKINLIVLALTVVLAATVLALELRSMRESVHEEVVAANRVAGLLLQGTAMRYAAQGMPTMLAFLQSIGRIRSNDITLFDAQGTELYRSPPPTYKAGRNAPDWFSALIAPAPTVQTIEFPGGRLVVQANATRAEVDAWDYVKTLALASLACLVVVNALVFWLVGRALRPLGQVVRALERLREGRFDASLPPLAGAEAAAIGAAFNRMVRELDRHIETERRAVRAETQLSDSRELTRWIDQHVEAERRMIARELHDEFGQSVTAMRSMALSIAQRVHALDPQAEQAARLIADESSRLYDAMHGIIPRLTPLVLDNFGLAEALADLAERTRRAHAGAALELDVDLADAALGAEGALALYRAAQEGLTNALRHGQARHLRLSLRRRGEALVLEVQDDGHGLPIAVAPQDPHYGLRWLSERVRSLGGTVDLEDAAPRGARLRVSLPVGAAGATPVPAGQTAQATHATQEDA